MDGRDLGKAIDGAMKALFGCGVLVGVVIGAIVGLVAWLLLR